jgi:hypothetical protein
MPKEQRFFKYIFTRHMERTQYIERRTERRLDLIQKCIEAIITRRENVLTNTKETESKHIFELSITELNNILGLIDIMRDRKDLR